MVMYIKTCSRSVQLRILEEYVIAEWYVYVEHFCDHLLFVRMDISDQEQPPPAAPIATNVDASTGSNQVGTGAGAGSSSSSSLGENKRRTGWKGAGAARGGRSRRRNYNP